MSRWRNRDRTPLEEAVAKRAAIKGKLKRRHTRIDEMRWEIDKLNRDLRSVNLGIDQLLRERNEEKNR